MAEARSELRSDRFRAERPRRLAVPRSRAASLARRLLAFAAPFIVWAVAEWYSTSRLLPSIGEVVDRLWQDLTNGVIWENAQVTFTRGFIGLGLAIVIGISLGILMARSRWADALFEPSISAFYPVPKFALFPIFILILGFGAWSKIVLVALECAYPITYNTYSGVQSTQRDYLWVARNVGARRRDVAAMFLRSASPAIMASLRMAVPIMLVIMIITEFLGESVGLGFLLVQATTSFEPEGAMAVILLLAIVGFVLDRIIVFLTRRVAFWAQGAEL